MAVDRRNDNDKYVGGTTFRDSVTGELYDVGPGDFTSPSGKESHIGEDGTVTTTHSSREESIGDVFGRDETGEWVQLGNNGSGKTPAWSRDYNQTYGSGTVNYGGVAGGGSGGRGGGVSMQVKALEKAMGNNKAALEAAYDASRGELESSIASAQQQAYVNSQKAMKNLPQAMAAGGYNGGVTETTAASIQNEYQNALSQLEQAKAQELARMQANLANGIADSDSQYQIQLANALAQAEQLAWEQQQAEAEMELRQKAAALEEMKYLDSKNQPASGSGTPYKPRLTYAQALEQLNAGNTNDVVMEAANYYGLSTGPKTTTTTPTSYYDALRQAQQQGTTAPLMAYYKSKGMSSSEIAAMINSAVGDKESAIYGFTS